MMHRKVIGSLRVIARESGREEISDLILRSRAQHGVSKDGYTAPKSGLPDFGTKDSEIATADFGCSLPSFETPASRAPQDEAEITHTLEKRAIQ
jgi:hypothetical protein